MQVSVEKVSNIERRLTITVPADQVEAAFAKQMNQVASKANIKGFRPGKAPMTVIQQRFGNDARKEALSEVMQNALYEAITKNNLRPVSTPQVQPKSILANQPLEFTAMFEVLPELEKVHFSMPSIEKLEVTVSEEDLGRVLEHLGKQYTKWQVVEREAGLTDRVVIDYYAVFEGHSDADKPIRDYPIELGSKAMLPGFDEGLMGVKAGDERVLQLHFPKDFPAADKAGKPIEFVIKVKQVFAADVPALDEKFAKQLGVKSGNIDELKTQIKQSLEQERDRMVKEKLKEQIFGQLLTQNPLDVPKALIAREAGNIHDEVYPQHQHHDHHQHSAEETATFNDIAKKRVLLGLLIAEYAKQENITPDKTRVEARIQEIASAYENPKEVMEWLATPERLDGIQAQVMEDLVLDKLMQGVPQTIKTIGYAELKGIRV